MMIQHRYTWCDDEIGELLCPSPLTFINLSSSYLKINSYYHYDPTVFCKDLEHKNSILLEHGLCVP